MIRVESESRRNIPRRRRFQTRHLYLYIHTKPPNFTQARTAYRILPGPAILRPLPWDGSPAARRRYTPGAAAQPPLLSASPTLWLPALETGAPSPLSELELQSGSDHLLETEL